MTLDRRVKLLIQDRGEQRFSLFGQATAAEDREQALTQSRRSLAACNLDRFAPDLD